MELRSSSVSFLAYVMFFSLIAGAASYQKFINRTKSLRARCTWLLCVSSAAYVASQLLLLNTLRNLRPALDSLVESVSGLVGGSHDRLFRYIDIYSSQCQLKFVCEAATWLSVENRSAGTVLQLLNYFVDYQDNSFRGALWGASGLNCTTSYGGCKHSPLRGALPFVPPEVFEVKSTDVMAEIQLKGMFVMYLSVLIVICAVIGAAVYQKFVKRSRAWPMRFAWLVLTLIVVYSMSEFIFYSIMCRISENFRGLGERVDIPREFYDGMFGMMGINNHDCRLKFLCEASSLIPARSRNVGNVLGLMNSFIDVKDEFFRELLRGATGVDCSSSYGDCEESPFKERFLSISSEL